MVVYVWDGITHASLSPFSLATSSLITISYCLDTPPPPCPPPSPAVDLSNKHQARMCRGWEMSVENWRSRLGGAEVGSGCFGWSRGR